MKRLPVAWVLLAVLLAAPVSATPLHPAEIADLSAQWAGYWNAKNVKAIMALYAPDPTFMPTVGRPWIGQAAIRKGFAGVLKVYEPDIHLTSVTAEQSGNLAYDSGTYDETLALVKGGKAVHAKGCYLFVFAHQKRGGWKIVQQTWTEFEPIKL